MRRIAELFFHLVFWVLLVYLARNNIGMRVIAVVPIKEAANVRNFGEGLWIVLAIDMILKMALFYIATLRFLPNYFQEKNRKNLLRLIALFLGTFLLSVIINYVIVDNYLAPLPTRMQKLFSLSLLLHLFTMLLALAYSLLKERFRTERIQKEIEEEKLRTELDFLKAQINPHFLFNTLNNLYAESKRHTNATLSNGIAKLSHMMRYVIYDSNVAFVPLEKELEFLDSFIDLHLLRISPEDPFELKKYICEYDSSITIAPILFLPLVENAFKHGVKVESPSYIHISLDIDQNWLLFYVENSKANDNRKSEPSGIGLSNIRRRLELIYPDRHALEIEDYADKFCVTLKLQIKD